MNSYFKKGSGCFTCDICGKKTRNTTGDNANDFSCAKCLKEWEEENESPSLSA